VFVKVGGIVPLGPILRDEGANKTKEAIGGKTTQRGRKRSTWVLSFPTSHLVEKEFSAVTLMLSEQRNRSFTHKRGDLRLHLTKMSPNTTKHCACRQAGTEFMGRRGGHNIFCLPQHFVMKSNVVVQIS